MDIISRLIWVGIPIIGLSIPVIITLLIKNKLKIETQQRIYYTLLSLLVIGLLIGLINAILTFGILSFWYPESALLFFLLLISIGLYFRKEEVFYPIMIGAFLIILYILMGFVILLLQFPRF